MGEGSDVVSYGGAAPTMKAVVLVGGVGTRLRPLTYVIPKCMLPVGAKPLLERTIAWLKEYGIEEVVLCVAYLKNRIKEYFGDGEQMGVKISYAETDMPMGTGGQLKSAQELLGDQSFITMNGDILTSLNLGKMIELHRRRNGIGTLALKKFEIKVPYGNISLGGRDRIMRFDEKPTLSFNANAGVYVLSPKIFEYIPADVPVSLETETFPSALDRGEQLNAYYQDAYWADVGNLVDYEKVDKEILTKYFAKTEARI
jgi:NDP-sugar pyrophosphorylase family protein